MKDQASLSCASSLFDVYQLATLRQAGLSLVVTAGPEIALASKAVAIDPYKNMLGPTWL